MDRRFLNGHEAQGLLDDQGERPRTPHIDNKTFLMNTTFCFLIESSHHYGRITIPWDVSHPSLGHGRNQRTNLLLLSSRAPSRSSSS